MVSAINSSWRTTLGLKQWFNCFGKAFWFFTILRKTTVLLWPPDISVVSPGKITCSNRMGSSPLLLLGTLRQGLQVELQHVPSIFVSAEISLGIRKKTC